MTAPHSSPHFEGSLRELALADVLQLLELGRKTGRLTVVDATGAPAGALDLSDGFVTAAYPASGEREGDPEDVVSALLPLAAGRFAFHPEDAVSHRDGPPPRRLRVEGLLVEAARRADEWTRVADVIPHAAAVPELAPDDGAPLALDARAWALLAEVDGQRDVSALARALGRDVVEVAGELAVLVRGGLLRIRPEGADVPSAAARSSSW